MTRGATFQSRIGQLSDSEREELENIISEAARAEGNSIAEWKRSIGKIFHQHGFDTKTRRVVRSRGDSKQGILGLLSARESLVVAMDFGKCGIKQKSVIKLNQVDQGAIRLVGLCNGTFNGPALEIGIDYVFSKVPRLIRPCDPPDER